MYLIAMIRNIKKEEMSRIRKTVKKENQIQIENRKET